MPDYSHLIFRQRVDKMILDARQRYGCAVSVNQLTRTQEQAQQFHVCHMFLHNKFRHQRPKHLAADGKTISWEHLSSPLVSWSLIPHPEQLFLHTKAGRPAQKKILGDRRVIWAPGAEPDKEATIHAMSRFLRAAHVSGMAAPGIDGCGEPCGCGGHASKHITGAACDVSGMDILGRQILKHTKGVQSPAEALDHFLAEYLLFRPLAHLPEDRREVWHLEALPHHHSRRGHTRHPSTHQQQHPHPHGPPPQTLHPHVAHPKTNSHSHDPGLHPALNAERLKHQHGC